MVTITGVDTTEEAACGYSRVLGDLADLEAEAAAEVDLADLEAEVLEEAVLAGIGNPVNS